MVLMAALLIPLAGCGDGEFTLQLQEGDTFTIAISEAVDTLNPVTTEGGVAEEMFLLVYDSLWRLDENGEPVASLVTSYSLSSDQLTWTIRLRQDVTFSDGTALTSADVKFTYELMKKSTLYADYLDGITDIRCPDDYTVVITTSYVKGDMMYNIIPILPKSYWSSYSDSPGSYDNAAMIGSGPFVCVATDDGWLFQARADYFGGAAQVGYVHFVRYETETAAARAISAGEVDACYGLTDVQVLTLDSVPGVELVQTTLAETEIWALALNCAEDGFFSNQTMRQMLEYCLDRDTIFSLMAGENGQSGYGWASSGAAYAVSMSDTRDYDLATAEYMLWGVAYDIDDDGDVEYYTTEEDVVLTLYSAAQDVWASTTGTLLVEALESIGVQVTWTKTDAAVTSVCKAGGNWDICLCSWLSSYNPVVAGYRFYSEAGDITGWTSSEYDSLYVTLRSTLDWSSMSSLAGQLQRMVYEQCPCIILGYGSGVQAIRSDRWTGYEDIVQTSGGLFATGTVAVYLNVTALEAGGVG